MPSLFAAKAPADTRPREAIEGVRAFVRGENRKGLLRPLVSAAYAAAREVGDPAAEAAARSAGVAAGSVFIHTEVTLNQAKHALGSAAYAALARTLAADDNSDAGDGEIRWAIEHASPTLREILRRMPVRAAGRGRLDQLLYQLDAGLRG